MGSSASLRALALSVPSAPALSPLARQNNGLGCVRRRPPDNAVALPPRRIHDHGHRYILPTMLAVIVAKVVADAIAPLSIYEEHINLRG